MINDNKSVGKFLYSKNYTSPVVNDIRDIIYEANRYNFKAKKLLAEHRKLVEHINGLASELNRMRYQAENNGEGDNVLFQKMSSLNTEINYCQANLGDDTLAIQDADNRSRSSTMRAINVIKNNNINEEKIAEIENIIIINIASENQKEADSMAKNALRTLIGAVLTADRSKGKEFQSNLSKIDETKKKLISLKSLHSKKYDVSNPFNEEKNYMGNKVKLEKDMASLEKLLKKLEVKNKSILFSLNTNQEVLNSHKDYEKALYVRDLARKEYEARVSDYEIAPFQCDGVVSQALANYNSVILPQQMMLRQQQQQQQAMNVPSLELFSMFSSFAKELMNLDREKDRLHKKMMMIQMENERLKRIVSLSMQRINMSRQIEKNIPQLIQMARNGNPQLAGAKPTGQNQLGPGRQQPIGQLPQGRVAPQQQQRPPMPPQQQPNRPPMPPQPPIPPQQQEMRPPMPPQQPNRSPMPSQPISQPPATPQVIASPMPPQQQPNRPSMPPQPPIPPQQQEMRPPVPAPQSQQSMPVVQGLGSVAPKSEGNLKPMQEAFNDDSEPDIILQDADFDEKVDELDDQTDTLMKHLDFLLSEVDEEEK